MPVSTDTLNDDVKELRSDLHKFETNITADVRELSTQVRGLLATIRILAVLTLSSLAGSIWWGATLTADVRNLSNQIHDLDTELKIIRVVPTSLQQDMHTPTPKTFPPPTPTPEAPKP